MTPALPTSPQPKTPSLVQTVLDLARSALGQAVATERWVQEFPPTRLDLTPAPRCIALADVVRWEEFGTPHPLQGPRREKGYLIGREHGRAGRCQGVSVQCQAIRDLVDHVVIQNWSCDISDVQGLAASKFPLEEAPSLEAMARATRPSLIEDVSAAGLAKNLAHDEIRILHRPEGGGDSFVRRGWDARLFLVNSGGSHHFAAAHALAKLIGQPVPLAGKLHRYTLNPRAVRELTQTYAMFAMENSAEAWSDLHDAFRSDQVTWLWCGMPHPFWETRAVFLPQSQPRAQRAAAVLRDAGVADLGQALLGLAGLEAPL